MALLAMLLGEYKIMALLAMLLGEVYNYGSICHVISRGIKSWLY